MSAQQHEQNHATPESYEPLHWRSDTKVYHPSNHCSSGRCCHRHFLFELFAFVRNYKDILRLILIVNGLYIYGQSRICKVSPRALPAT